MLRGCDGVGRVDRGMCVCFYLFLAEEEDKASSSLSPTAPAKEP